MTYLVDDNISRPPLPPFTLETASIKVRKAEDGWNSKNPIAVAKAYTQDSKWRNRSEIFQGRKEIIAFLKKKWVHEKNYRLVKEIWAYKDNRIAVRFAYEYHNQENQWYRAYGNENWEFDQNGLMKTRHASINDVAINEAQRLFTWESKTRPEDHPSLTEMGL